jgi:Family of unknown function (DUF5762)
MNYGMQNGNELRKQGSIEYTAAPMLKKGGDFIQIDNDSQQMSPADKADIFLGLSGAAANTQAPKHVMTQQPHIAATHHVTRPTRPTKKKAGSAGHPTTKPAAIPEAPIGPPFWTQNPNILMDKDYMLEFFPTGEMTFNQKLNAVTRSVLILTVMGLILTSNPLKMVFIGFFCVLSIIAMFHYYKKAEGFDLSPAPVDPAIDYLDETDLLDSNVPLFQQPSPKNPYGNVLVSDYELNPEKLPAPPASNPIVQDMVTTNALKMVQEANPGQPDIAQKLFRDINEQLNFEQMNRQFVSNPATTIPNDQGAFADFCYGSMLSCKEGNLFACARNTSHYTNY